MKTFIVPTDFSKHSALAVDFAIKLGKAVQAEIKLLHVNVFLPEVGYSSHTNIELLAKHNQDIKDAMTTYEAMLRDADLKYQCIVLTDPFVRDGIISCANEFQADLIIMGSFGVGDSFMKKLMGSTASAVLDKAEVPVIVVPNTMQAFDVKELIFATSWSCSEDKDCLSSVKDLAAKLGIGLTILTVRPMSESQRGDEKILEITRYMNDQGIKAEVQSISSMSLEEALRRYMAGKPGGLVCMLTHKRGVLAKFCQPSVVTHLVKHIEFPILAFPCKR